MRKGQGAMEYLMTYGWALLVIVIVGAALFALGILNPATYQQKRCNGFQYFTYIDSKANTSSFTLHLRNGVNDMNVSSITVGSTPDSSPVVLKGGVPVTPGSYNINQGDELVILADGLTLTSGAYDDLSVTVTYNVKDGIQGNTDTATCVGTVV